MEGKERLALVKTSVDQSIFREQLLKKYNTCCLCKVGNQALLTANHIKPYEMVQQETSEMYAYVKGRLREKYHIWKRLEKNGYGMT